MTSPLRNSDAIRWRSRGSDRPMPLRIGASMCIMHLDPRSEGRPPRRGPAMAADTANNTAQSAVNEATRVAAEASRRAVDGAKTASQALRTYMDETAAANRALYRAWSANAEATLKTAF